MRAVFLFCFAVLVVGCANPVNQHTAYRYGEQAYNELEAGNWFNARMGFGRAITNGEIGGLDEKAMAVLWYEYGRASGVICDWVEAERGLNKSYELDKKYGGPAFMSSYELGQLNFERKQYAKAIDYFARAHPEIKEAKADVNYPLSYANYLEDYAAALSHTGQVEKAQEYKALTEQLRQSSSDKEPKTSRTPYGQQCGESP